jgi:hypothetical protein
MPGPLLICTFLFIVFAPCLVAFDGGFGEDDYPDHLLPEKWQRPRRRGADPAPMQAMLPELALAKDFQIRSFPKGLSQRRIVVRDGEDGVRLTIAQVRAAAIELLRLGGMAAAYEFALVAAASAATMTAVKDAFAVAARETLEAARNAYARLAWGHAMQEECGRVWENGPPIAGELPVVDRRWRETSQAA